MPDTWIQAIYRQNAEIEAADDEVIALLRNFRELHQEGQDRLEAAGVLVTKPKRLLQPRDQPDREFRRGMPNDAT